MRATTDSSEGDDGVALRLRTAASTYVVFGSIFGVFLLIAVGVALRTPSAWKTVGLIAAFISSLMIYFATLELTVSYGVLTYHTLLRKRSVLLAAVLRSDFEWNFWSRDPRPFLVITRSDGGKQLRVNLKPFRRDGIRKLLALRALKLQTGDDERAERWV